MTTGTQSSQDSPQSITPTNLETRTDPHQNWVDNYPYDDIPILVDIMDDDRLVEIRIRHDLLIPLADSRKTELVDGISGNVLEHRPQGALREDVHFSVIRADDWPHCEPPELEHAARIAESFGLHRTAAEARRWIR